MPKECLTRLKKIVILNGEGVKIDYWFRPSDFRLFVSAVEDVNYEQNQQTAAGKHIDEVWRLHHGN